MYISEQSVQFTREDETGKHKLFPITKAKCVEGLVAAFQEFGERSGYNAVLYTAQTLDDEQKAQARENIGAASADDLAKIDEALDRIIEMQNSLIGGDGT